MRPSGAGGAHVSVDPVSRAEMQIGLTVAVTKQQQSERRLRQELEKRDFEERFRQMVNAAANFAKAYNEGKGMVWPPSEANKLGKALRKLQGVLHAAPGAAEQR